MNNNKTKFWPQLIRKKYRRCRREFGGTYIPTLFDEVRRGSKGRLLGRRTLSWFNCQAPVVRKADNVIHCITFYPVDNTIGSSNSYLFIIFFFLTSRLVQYFKGFRNFTKLTCLVRWVVIYLVDNAIHLFISQHVFKFESRILKYSCSPPVKQRTEIVRGGCKVNARRAKFSYVNNDAD